MEHTAPLVLVVDDDEIVRQYLGSLLQNNGYAVIEAPDGAEAMNIMRERNKDIAAVLSDIRMPNIDGLKLAELNYENGFLPFIVSTTISDAAVALKFLKFGVQDYLAKPVSETTLVHTVRNAINRRKLPHLLADDETPLPGNMGVITIPARFAEIERVQNWLELKTGGIIQTKSKQQQFLAFISEILMNAYEHGSLKLTEREKSALLDNGGYYDELRRREGECGALIEVAVSIVEDKIAISVTDSGYGFDYRHYQKMPEEEMLARLSMPNGRGIQMAMQYFDDFSFSKGGAKVLVTKRISAD